MRTIGQQGTITCSLCPTLLYFAGGDTGWRGSGLDDSALHLSLTPLVSGHLVPALEISALPTRKLLASGLAVLPAYSVPPSLVTSLQWSLGKHWGYAVCPGWAPGWQRGSWKALFTPTLGALQLLSGMAS